MDFVFLLTESEKNKGHWTLLMRNDDKFEYFDSYGNSPKEILKFTPAFMNKYLGNDWDKDLGKMIKSMALVCRCTRTGIVTKANGKMALSTALVPLPTLTVIPTWGHGRMGKCMETAPTTTQTAIGRKRKWP